MRKLALILSVCAALTAHARVLSYSPLTDRPAVPAVQDRSARYFAVMESKNAVDWSERQLVLYDIEGEEPHVAFPVDRGYETIVAAAAHHAGGNDPVHLLVIVEIRDGFEMFFSNDGGHSWSEVQGAGNAPLWQQGDDPGELRDLGGPFVGGMAHPIRLGNESMPFVISTESGVWGVGHGGDATRISTLTGRLVGQNRAGTQFLLRRPASNVATGSLHVIGVNGSVREILSSSPFSPQDFGWITSAGDVYVKRENGLYRSNGAALELLLAGESGPGSWLTAAPSGDFDGAWLADVSSEEPTRLLRHTRTGGLQQMWSDARAPKVEALIAGRSGQTVLLQVHGERRSGNVHLEDPALAVWRIGAPLPAVYDELYLVEEETRGFVHVDVDQVAAGDPFVFDSGWVPPSGDPIIAPAPGSGGDVSQEWGVVRTSLLQHLVLPGVARLPGAYDSYWVSDVTLFNSFNLAQEVEIDYVPLGAKGADARSVTITLQPRELRFVPDALAAWFGIEQGGGALHFLPKRGISAFGRTYSRSGAGTFGFGMMPTDFFNATSARFPVTFAGAFPGANFRTNMLLNDTSGHGTEAKLRVAGPAGTIGASGQTVTAPEGGFVQANSIGNALRLFSGEQGALIVAPTRGSAIAGVVAIDNRTNDPTYFPPDVSAAEGMLRTIPVIGHVDGANASHFRSDLFVYNPTETSIPVTFTVTHWHSGMRSSKTLTFKPFESRVIVDALPALFEVEGVARLDYATRARDGEDIRISSRTYTVESSGATYGTIVPPMNASQVAAEGESLEIVGVSGGGNFRTNLAIVELSNPGSLLVPVRIRVFDQAGTLLTNFTVEVQRGRGTQINDLFRARGVTPPTAALIVAEVLGSGRVSVYATLTDNVTNDTTFVGAHRAAME